MIRILDQDIITTIYKSTSLNDLLDPVTIPFLIHFQIIRDNHLTVYCWLNFMILSSNPPSKCQRHAGA